MNNKKYHSHVSFAPTIYRVSDHHRDCSLIRSGKLLEDSQHNTAERGNRPALCLSVWDDDFNLQLVAFGINT